MLHKEITEKIIGAAFEVHSFLGNGFQEVIYQRALVYEFSRKSLSFARELEMDIYYRDLIDPIGKRRVDFLVEDSVLVEVKAVKELENTHLAQVLNYLQSHTTLK